MWFEADARRHSPKEGARRRALRRVATGVGGVCGCLPRGGACAREPSPWMLPSAPGRAALRRLPLRLTASKLAFQPAAAAGPGPFGSCQAPGGGAAMAAAYHHLKGPAAAAAYSMNGIGLHTSAGVDLLHPGYPGKLD